MKTITEATGQTVANLTGYSTTPILGDGRDGVTRRDPSPVIVHDGTYYVYYSRSTTSHGGYSATVWYATSPDGHAWTEVGEALGRGPRGSFDEHAVFTPTTLVTDGAWYLIYTAVPEPFDNGNGGPTGTKTAIGIAKAPSPAGPFIRLSNDPILIPGDTPEDFDSHRCDDACVVVRGGHYWLYYKGRQMGKTPGETKMGCAVADAPAGPYRKLPENPLVNGGHEVCVWPVEGGVAGLFCHVGPEGNSLQQSEDGIHFRRVKSFVPPDAPGPFREDNYRNNAAMTLQWGIAHRQDRGGAPYLVRFDCEYE